MSSESDSIPYSFSYADAVDVLRLVRESAGVTSFEFELGEMKLSIVREESRPPSLEQAGPEVQPAQPLRVTTDGPPTGRNDATAAVPPHAVAAAVAALPARGQTALNAPMLGIFYRAPSPGAASFVQEGDVVQVGDVLGLIEVMKLFTQVTAECAGRIVRISASDKSLVEHGEPLMIIESLTDA